MVTERKQKLGGGRHFDCALNGRQAGEHVSDDLRWVVVSMFELHGLKRRKIRTFTQISNRTLSRIRKNYLTRGGVWGVRHKSARRNSQFAQQVDLHHKETLRRLLQEKPVAYIREIKRELFFETALLISCSQIIRTLLSMGYTRRRLSRLHHKANRFQKIAFRAHAREWVTGHPPVLFLLSSISVHLFGCLVDFCKCGDTQYD